MRAPWTSTLFRVNGKSAEMGWLMMAPLARPRRAQRQEVAQGGDEIAPTVDVGIAAVVGGHALDLRHGRQLRVQDRQIRLPRRVCTTTSLMRTTATCAGGIGPAWPRLR